MIPGPDFPSGGIIIDDGIRDAYQTGGGTVRIRARAEIVNITRSRKGIEITELPYLVGPERVVAKAKELVNKGKIDGITNITNLSDRKSGLRLVIECRSGVNPELLLEKLYRLSPLEETFGINNVVLVDGVPTTIGLYDLCRYYIEHRLDVVVRRTEYRLGEARRRLHLVEGLLIAIDNIDEVVAIIRSSADTPEARARLMERLELSREQADYVLELQLRRLTALAYDELVAEKQQLLDKIKDLDKILGSEQRQRTIVISELGEIVEKYGKPRRSLIVRNDAIPDLAELTEQVVAEVADDPCVVSLSASGLVGREPQGTAKSYAPSRHDVLQSVVLTSLQNPVFAITSSAKLLRTTVADLPEVGGRSRGKPGHEVFSADRGDRVVIVAGPSGQPLLVVTALGAAKRVDRQVLNELRAGKTVISLAKNDRVIAVMEVAAADDVVLVSSDAQVLRTPVEGISIQGPSAKGVAGIAVKGAARVVGAGVAGDNAIVVTVTDRGTAKVTAVDEIPVKGRGGSGVRLTKFKDERRIDYAWIGPNERAMCVVGQTGASTRPDNEPQPLRLRPTRRDGASSKTPSRILNIGPLRW